MILSFLFFFGSATLLTLEGMLLLRLFAERSLTFLERLSLGFPVGAFLNALLFFLLTLLKVPLEFWMVYGAHAVVFGGLVFFERGTFKATNREAPLDGACPEFDRRARGKLSTGKKEKLLLALLLLSLTVKIFFAFSHAVLLPTFYYDSLSQWNMRARISYEDRAIAFDLDEHRGMSKPQYPILLHALQITFMLPQGAWLDRVANSSTFLLTLSSFVAFFLLLKRKGSFFALITLTALTMAPLLSIHLGQGYGDIHVIEYLLLSALLLSLFVEDTSHMSFLLLSALFVVAAAWVKQEGFFFGIVPWLLIVSGWCFWKGKKCRQVLRFGFVPVLLLGIPWTLLLLARGLPLSPHGTGFLLEWHPEAIPHILEALFSYGSFGIFFYVLPVLLGMGLRDTLGRKKDALPSLLVLSWGLITFIETLFLYVFTPNVTFLLNNQTFHRTVLIPLLLLILGCALLCGRVVQRAYAHCRKHSHFPADPSASP